MLAKIKKYSLPVLWTVLAMVLALRLFGFVDQYGSVLIVMDKWHTLEPLFYHQSWWEGFSLQHGPHRMGLIYFLFKANTSLGEWNNRWDLFTQAAFYVLSCILALKLKFKLFGSWQWSDLCIPLIFLNLHSAMTVLNNPYVHGLLPLFSLLLCYLYFIKHPVWRVSMLMLFAFLVTFTGFGFVLAPVLITLELVLFFKTRPRFWWKLLPSLTAFSSFVYIFFTNVPKESWEKFPFTAKAAVKYSLALTNNIFLVSPNNRALAAGAVLLAGIACLFFFLLRSQYFSLKNPVFRSLFIILGGVVVFWALNIYGRAHLSVGNAHVSRYIPVGMLFALAVYFGVLELQQPKYLKQATLMLLLFLLLRVQLNTQHREAFAATRATYYAKVSNCLRTEGPDFYRCSGLHPNYIHPAPKRIRIQEKLKYLKDRQLNIWAPHLN